MTVYDDDRYDREQQRLDQYRSWYDNLGREREDEEEDGDDDDDDL